LIACTLVVVGRLSERHWLEAAADYQKRLGAFCKLNLVEIPESRLPANPTPGDIRRALEEEGRAIRDKLPPKARMVCLCVEGKALPSEALADYVAAAGQEVSHLAFVMGGSYGLDNNIKSHAHLKLSLSAMTFPHQLARVLLLEQLYRAFTIGAGLPYHK
jgi:23S rRNA (pseudouridine1915-N3)-methyltransferase